MVGIFIALGVYVFILIHDSENLVKSAQDNENNRYFNIDIAFSVHLKIFLNYVQMISSFSQLDLQLPNFIYEYLNMLSLFGSSTQFVSFDCLAESIYFILLIILFPLLFMIN